MAVLVNVPFSAPADPKAGTSAIFDPAGDAVFPFDLYGEPVPPYLDVVTASVKSKWALRLRPMPTRVSHRASTTLERRSSF
jgi:hypothetical protein